ncbi:MAG: hypothetical protein JSV33_01010 [bacterium]|nr:MAG: hypothetical protein JSV33_01010 [bacterium]
MSKLFSIVLLAALCLGMVAGCGGKVEHSYVMTTIREASRGDLLSPGFKFGFDTPNIISAHKNLALVREGNLIEFFSGEDIEQKVMQVGGRKFVVGARKLFTPLVHFTVDFMVAGGDSIRVGEPYSIALPTLMRTAEYAMDDFIEVDLDALTSNRLKLRPIQNTKFRVDRGMIMHEEIEEGGEMKMVYTLHLENVRFIIEDPSDEIQLVLKALMNEKMYFDGGVSYGRIASRGFRESTNSGGTVKIAFINYSGWVIPSEV